MEQTPPAADPMDPWVLADQLAAIGATRAQDVARGGDAWAQFNDWCWAEDLPVSREALDEWLLGERLSATVRERLFGLVDEPQP